MRNLNKYLIEVNPKAKGFIKHIWLEGGIFNTKDSAESQVDQLKKTGIYSSVDLIELSEDESDVLDFITPDKNMAISSPSRAKKEYARLLKNEIVTINSWGNSHSIMLTNKGIKLKYGVSDTHEWRELENLKKVKILDQGLSYKFPEYNPPVDLSQYRAPESFKKAFPFKSDHFTHSEHKYRIPGEIIYGNKNIEVRLREGKKDIHVSVLEVLPEGYKDMSNMDKRFERIDDQWFESKEDLDSYLLSLDRMIDEREARMSKIRKDLEDKYTKKEECSSCDKPLEEIPESFSDCLKRNGINLEKESHRFEIGTVIKDNISGNSFKVSDLGDKFITITFMSALGLSRGYKFDDTYPSYSELIDLFSKGDISVNGFLPEEKMEFARVLNTIQHCAKMDILHRENEALRILNGVLASIKNKEDAIDAVIRFASQDDLESAYTIIENFSDLKNQVDNSNLTYSELVDLLIKQKASDRPSVETVTDPEAPVPASSDDIKEAIEGLQALLSLTTDKKEKKEIREAIKALKLIS